MLARVIYGARISLSIGLVGVAISFVLGCLFGGVSGYYGGAADLVIQRVIAFMLSIPTIPLWMVLSAALPPRWPPVRVFVVITVILAIAGHADGAIIARHLLPSFMSYLIVSVTLSIPGMILGETALSFLGLGLHAPVVSWGVLLQDAQNFRAVAIHPWLLFPALAVIVTVLMFNFLGDGLRDAADPYKR